MPAAFAASGQLYCDRTIPGIGRQVVWGPSEAREDARQLLGRLLL
jgi:hypothetical protein